MRTTPNNVYQMRRLSWPAVEPTGAPGRTARSDSFAKQDLVLVVDDREENRALCRECLVYAGFIVIEAKDGADAVTLAGARLPDVVVMDVAMPVLDGYDACRRLKLDPRTKDIPVILLTATPACAGVEEGTADALLLKPCTPDLLESEVRKWLAIRHERRRGATRERGDRAAETPPTEEHSGD
jgi:CheY-like chemotaxis protein